LLPGSKVGLFLYLSALLLYVLGALLGSFLYQILETHLAFSLLHGTTTSSTCPQALNQNTELVAVLFRGALESRPTRLHSLHSPTSCHVLLVIIGGDEGLPMLFLYPPERGFMHRIIGNILIIQRGLSLDNLFPDLFKIILHALVHD
jgi:hypothetical protein